jgi:hypothetical protein
MRAALFALACCDASIALFYLLLRQHDHVFEAVAGFVAFRQLRDLPDYGRDAYRVVSERRARS